MFLMSYDFNDLFYSVGLRHLFKSKFLPLMGKLSIGGLALLGQRGPSC